MIKEYLVDSDGAFTKTGQLLYYKEIHSFQCGIIEALNGNELEEGYKRSEEYMEHDIEWHYYSQGYTYTDKIKFW